MYSGLGGAKRPNRWALFVAAVAMIVMIGFRREVGADWWPYLYIFNTVSVMDFGQALVRSDPGYALLNWIAGRAGWGIWFPNLVCATIFTWGLVTFCRQQPNVWLALTVAVPFFLIGVAMGLTRQSAAIGFIMLALVAHLRGQLVRVVIFIALATLFHFSAVVTAAILSAASVKRGAAAVALLSLLMLLVYYQFGERFTSRLAFYSEREFTATGDIVRLLMNVVPGVIFLSFRHRFTSLQAESRLWTIMSVMACVSLALILLVEGTVIVDRLGLYVVPLQIFVLSRIPYAFGPKSRPSMLLLTAIVAYSLALEVAWLNLGTWGHAWLPYRNYLWDEGTGEAPPTWFRWRR